MANDIDKESVKSEGCPRSKRPRGNLNNTYRNHTTVRKQRAVENMAPFQTTVSVAGDTPNPEVIEVQILPQDDNWGENTTAITGNTSDGSQSTDGLTQWPGEIDMSFNFIFHRYLGIAVTFCLSLLAFISPIAMVVLPKIGLFPALTGSRFGILHRSLNCGAECKGHLISLAFKLIILAAGSWAVFLRRPHAIVPHFMLFRAIVLVLVFITTFAYWLFYIVQVTESAIKAATPDESTEYGALVVYACSLTDILLYIHYLAVILLEIRHLQPYYFVKIVRSPDGVSRSYRLGQLSVQRAAIWLLQHYYTDFPIYNPYLERIPISKSHAPRKNCTYKFYDVDVVGRTPVSSELNVMQNNSSSTLSMRHGHLAHRRRDSTHNERFYEEHEYERRVKKRRARLITAAEEAFTHIKRLHSDNMCTTSSAGIPMDPHEAAQAIFPTMARSLQKFLRATRQQPQYTIESILEHLAKALSNDVSPKTFLEPFLNAEPVLQHEKEVTKEIQTWSLVSDELLTRPIRDGCSFQLRQNDITLVCTIRNLPSLNIREEVVDPKSNKFVLRLNSETSV